MIFLKQIIKVIKIFIITLVFYLSLSIPSYANQSVEEIIKGRNKGSYIESFSNENVSQNKNLNTYKE